jgi:hypothetical protein
MISVVICTHNPREDYLQRVLSVLKEQTLPKNEWELLLVDNASASPLSGQWDLSWHPQARIVRENTTGLTHARLCGIQNTSGELIVFVDDDNLLAPDYLENALAISRRLPCLGVFNGSIQGEFETVPSASVQFLLPQMAVREVSREEWACLGVERGVPVPLCGAGMVVRREMALVYYEKVALSPLRKSLGRSGTQLAAGEDSDLALCSCQEGYAVGVFPDLRLTHLIPTRRLEKNYLLKLVEGTVFSHIILDFIWKGEKSIPLPRMQPCLIDRLVLAYKKLRTPEAYPQADLFELEVAEAQWRGREAARNFLLKNLALED